MALIKKHWLAALLSCVGVVTALVCVVAFYVGVRPAQALGPEEEEQVLSAVAYSRIEALREELCLRNDNLAAMGCSQETTESVLKALMNWYDLKKTLLEQAQKDKALDLRELRNAQRSIHIGPRDEVLLAQYPGLKQAFSDAADDHQDLVMTAVSSIEAQLSMEQKSVWQAVRGNGDAFGPYRYVPDLTNDQLRSLRLAWRSRARNRITAETAEERSAVLSAFNEAERNILSFGQREALATAKSNQRSRSAGVLGAAHEVLPLPDELKAMMAVGDER